MAERGSLPMLTAISPYICDEFTRGGCENGMVAGRKALTRSGWFPLF